jgi:hypothetical protein
LDLVCEVRCEVFDPLQRLAVVIEAWRVQPEERLIVPQVPHQMTVTKNVAVVAASTKNRNTCAFRLHRHDGSLLSGDSFGSMQKRQDLILSLPQLMAQLGRDHAGWSIAPQLAAVGPEPDVAAL